MWKRWDLNWVCLSSKHKLSPNIPSKILSYNDSVCQLSFNIHLKTTAKDSLNYCCIYTVFTSNRTCCREARYQKKSKPLQKFINYFHSPYSAPSPPKFLFVFHFKFRKMDEIIFKINLLVKKKKGMCTGSNCNSIKKYH